MSDTGMNVTRDTLNDVMQFDHVIRVRDDGTVENVADVYAPELYDGELLSEDWTLLTGYTGQYGYRGPIMHNSEFIGGRLADDILSTPGVYVALVNEPSDGDEDPEGWAVARRD